MIDPLERWRALGLPDKPDYAGLLTFSALPYTQDPRGARRSRRRDRRRADGRSRLRPARHALRAAGDPRGQLPARPAPRDGYRRVRGASRRRLRRRARRSRRRRWPRTPRSSDTVAPGRRRRLPAGRARRRPLDHRAERQGRRRERTGPSASSTSTPTRTRVRRCSASSVSHGTPMYRLVRDGHVDGLRYVQIGLTRLLARPEGVRLAGRARDHELLHARRPRPRDQRASSSDDRAWSATGRSS